MKSLERVEEVSGSGSVQAVLREGVGGLARQVWERDKTPAETVVLARLCFPAVTGFDIASHPPVC